MSSNRMYISDEDKIISGVCGGIAENLNTDPTIIRILFVLGTLVTGLWIGCLAYYLFTLFLPVHTDGAWREYHSTKKVKNVFLYSLVVLMVYSPIFAVAIYIIALVLGISLLCII